ncbi:MAG: hypothetical protein RL484_574 [Actinomycetota bacterium]
MGLGEAVVLSQVSNLPGVFLMPDLFHDLKPVGHLLPIALFNSGEVGLAGWVFRHGAIVIASMSTISTL